LSRVPWALIILRLACAPVILVAAWYGWPGSTLFAIAVVALLTDVFDGIIARRLGIDVECLRQTDSSVDTIFYFAAGAALLLRFPDVWRHYWGGIAGLVIVELGRMAFEWRKFGRVAAYHMLSAKAWGVAMLLGFGEVTLTGRAGPLFTAAIVIGVIQNIEGLSASMLLREWHHDVPSVWHAMRLERRLERVTE
jgi:CDP-diacylglycerol---glycerol-3-phosphate 3-phosphatidyltransferase